MKKFLKNGLKEGVENQDIKKIYITYTPSYGHLLTYDYINSEDGHSRCGHSKWVDNPEKYINYITNNGGYNGPEMYRKFSEIVGGGIIIPLVFLILYVLKSIKCKIQKSRTI